VADADVFVAGCVLDASRAAYDVATIWRNGVAQSLSDGTSPACAEGIAISGTDVYAVGHISSEALLWKNGVAQVLPHGTGASNATGVAVAGGDVYVAGWTVQTTEVAPGSFVSASVATVWKNGVAASLSDPRLAASARAVVLEGADVYVAGDVNAGCIAPCGSQNVATVWKNGVPMALTDGKLGAAATSVVVASGKVYAAGLQSSGTVDVATFWADDVPTRLGDGSPGVGNGIAVAG
jgi:hypothetical protein